MILKEYRAIVANLASFTENEAWNFIMDIDNVANAEGGEPNRGMTERKKWTELLVQAQIKYFELFS